MKIDELIGLLNHTKRELGGDAEIVFQYGTDVDARQYDFGEKGRTDSNCCVTPYETKMHVDGWGRYVLSIRRIPRLKATPEMEQAYVNSLKQLGISEEGIAKAVKKQEAFERLMDGDKELIEYIEQGLL